MYHESISGIVAGMPMLETGYYRYMTEMFICIPGVTTLGIISQGVFYILPTVITVLLSLSSYLKLSRVHRVGIQQAFQANREATESQAEIRRVKFQNPVNSNTIQPMPNHTDASRAIRTPRPTLFPQTPRSSVAFLTGNTAGPISKNDLRATKALTFIHLPVSVGHLLSFIARCAVFTDNARGNVYGAVSIMLLGFFCCVQPLITLAVSSTLRKAFINWVKKRDTTQSSVFSINLENPLPRETQQVEVPEFLRAKSGLRLQVEVVKDQGSPGSVRRISVSRISNEGSELSITDLEYPSNGSLSSIICQADSRGRSPSLSGFSLLTLNVTDLPLPSPRSRGKMFSLTGNVGASPITRHRFFGTSIDDNDRDIIQRASSLPIMRVNSPYKRVIPRDMNLLATVEDKSAASTPRTSMNPRYSESSAACQ